MSERKLVPSALSHEPRLVDLGAIERELSEFWKHPDPSCEPPLSRIRACMSNLIVYCSSSVQASVVPEEIDEIVRIHPCRVLLLEAESEGITEELEAYVSAHCHMAGDRSEVCSEHVTIRASRDGVCRLPSTARSLLIGDLPTSLWWASREPPPLGGEMFEELGAMSDQVIFSSLSWPEHVRAFRAAAKWVLGIKSGRPAVTDLAWRRLKPWRHLIAQALDPAAMPGALEGITDVAIEHGPQSGPQAWMLLGWLASRLEWRFARPGARKANVTWWNFTTAQGPINVQFRQGGEGDPEVRTLTATTQLGDRRASLMFGSVAPGRLAMTRVGEDCVPRVLAAPNQSRGVLVGLEIQELVTDPLFRDAVEVARHIADALD